MAQDYKIDKLRNLNESPLDNRIPLNIPNFLTDKLGYNIPHPTLSQIALDILPIYKISPILVQNEFDTPVDKRKSSLNTVIMDSLNLTVYGKDIGSDEFSFVNGVKKRNKIQLTFDDVLIDVVQTKNIVKTEIAGNNGTVKEFIGFSDYEISIHGRMTGTYMKKPDEIFLTLHKYLQVNKTIECSSKFLINLGITNMIVTNFEFPQVEGEYSTQYFTINGISDLKPEETFIKFKQ